MRFERITKGLSKMVRKLNILAAQLEREEIETKKAIIRLEAKKDDIRAEWNRTVTTARNIEKLLGGL